MSCDRCDDGWIYVNDGGRACECQRRARPAHAGGYSPGGNAANDRRIRARHAGLASGAARRQRSTAKRQPRARSRQIALALRYRTRQVDAEEFERLYREWCEAHSVPFDRRGLNSVHALYVAQMTAYRVQGQDFETTNAQAARALELRGRPRCRRTIQRLRKRLAGMGLVAYEHVKRSGQLRIPGQMDTLRVRMLSSLANVTPPSGAGAGLVPRPRSCSTDPQALSPPPSAADVGTPATPAEGSDEGGTGELMSPPQFPPLTWVQLKLSYGLGSELELHRLRQLDRLGQPFKPGRAMGRSSCTPTPGRG